MSTKLAKAKNPLVAERRKVYDAMTPALQHVADHCKELLSTTATAEILNRYDLGKHIQEVTTEEGKYSPEAVKELSVYLGVTREELYQLRDLATAYSRDFIEQWTKREMAGGGHLHLMHWMLAKQLATSELIEKALKKVLADNISVRDFRDMLQRGQLGNKKHTRAGGRTHTRPSSVVGGLNKLESLNKSLFQYCGDPVLEGILEPLEELSSDTVTEIVVDKIRETEEQMDETLEKLQEVRGALHTQRERAEQILEQVQATKESAAASTNGAEDGSKPTTARRRGAATSNGHAGKGKKGKKAKKKGVHRPEPAGIV